MAICGLSLHLGTTESRKNLEQKFIFQIGTLNPHGINKRLSFNDEMVYEMNHREAMTFVVTNAILL